jgi:hypothetical protein
MKRFAALLALSLTLAGCGSEKPLLSTAEPFHIADVQAVGPAAPGVADWQAEDLRQQTMAYAAFVPATANPRILRVRIVNFHKKNPGLSLLVGDANRMEVAADLMSADGTQSMGTFSAAVTTDAYVNGIIGAGLATDQSAEEAARKLDQAAGAALMEKIYGTKAWKSWSKGRR